MSHANAVNRLAAIDRVTGEPIRRYEHDHPGSLLHVDVTKFGKIPDGGGWRFVGLAQGEANRRATRDRTGIKAGKYHPKIGTCFVHTVIDDFSRVAYAEICDDENAETAVAVLHRATAWFAEHGVRSNACCLTTAPATALSPGATRAHSSASPTSEPVPIVRRPTARSVKTCRRCSAGPV